MVRHFHVTNSERERVIIAPTERVAAERFARFTGELPELVWYGSAVPTAVLGLCAACERPILDNDPTLTIKAGPVHAECPMGRDA